MAKPPITEKECNQIISLDKTITSNISWTSKSSKSWSTCKLPVLNNADLNLHIYLTINNIDLQKFSIVLLLNGTHRIKGLCFSSSHLNKCSDGKRWDCSLHKHAWLDACPGGHAYTPEDITGDTLEEVFIQFCRECNIEFRGNFSPLAFQTQSRL